MYQVVYDAIHAKSGQSGPLKLQYIRTEKEIVMGWVSLSVRAPDLLSTEFLDNTTIRALHRSIAEITQDSSHQRCQLGYSLGQKGGNKVVFARCTSILRGSCVRLNHCMEHWVLH